MSPFAPFAFHKQACLIFIIVFLLTFPAFAATSVPFTINLSKAVNVTGTPRIAIDVGGVTRYATYSSGTGTSALTFTYSMVAGDVDLDGVTVSSPMDLNGGTIKDLAGNDLSPLTFSPPNTSSVKVNYPSLGMDFIYDADGRYTLNGTAYNDLTSFLTAAGGSFTRTSVGTYFDSAGVLQTAASGTPRFDFDPTTHAAKGILIEEARTNLFINGQGQGASGTSSPTGWSLDQGFGGLGYASTSSTTNSKGYGAFQFSINGTTSIGNRLLISPTSTRINVSANTNYTMTWGAELMGGSYPYGIQINFIWFDAGGTYLSSTLGTNRTSISSFTRYTDTTTSPANAATLHIRFDFTGYGSSGTTVNFTTQLSGIQLEQASFATSYIPTTTAALSRSSDLLIIPTGSWYSSAGGTITSNSALSYSGNTTFPYAAAWTMSDGTNSNKMRFFQNSTGANPGINMFNATISQASYLLPSIQSISTDYKLGFAYSTNDAIAYGQGAALGSADTTVTVPTMNTVSIGRGALSGESLYGWIKSFKYYPKRVPNTQLQLLTQ